MQKRETRVRFAPSPTGPLHMGGVRTALYNYLFAKQNQGKFILRIEDTDSQRFVPGAEAYIIEALRWCGIYPDEGVTPDGQVVETASEQHPHAPYRQSQRKPIYRQYAEELVAKGHAYYAFDSAEELDRLRKEAEAQGQTFTYNQTTRGSLTNSLTLSQEETQRRLREENHWTIRFKMPENRIVAMDDLIRGHVEVNTNTLDDKVLWKSVDQLPTYHLANIVDDHLMEITEVIRGEEWLPSLPLHYLLYEAFGWQDTQPRFAHLSLLLKPDGKGKLSKRDGDRLGFPVFPLKWVAPNGEVSRGYREDGYYPEAFVNLLALLGWNPGTEQELFTLEELVPAFSLDRIVRSGARFNADKAKWFNQEYLRKRSDALLAEDFRPILNEKGIHAAADYVETVVGLIKERAHFVQDFWELSSFFFEAPQTYDPQTVNKFWKADNLPLLKSTVEFVQGLGDFSRKHVEEELHRYIVENGMPMGKVMNGLRLMLVGASKGPGVADIIATIGKEAFIERTQRAFAVLNPA